MVMIYFKHSFNFIMASGPAFDLTQISNGFMLSIRSKYAYAAIKVGMVSGRINAHSKKRRPGNSQQATSQAQETPVKTDKARVPRTRMKDPFKYFPSTVSFK